MFFRQKCDTYAKSYGEYAADCEVRQVLTPAAAVSELATRFAEPYEVTDPEKRKLIFYELAQSGYWQ